MMMMMMKIHRNECFAVLLALCLSLIRVGGHRQATTKPSCGIDYGSSDGALPISDPTVSWAFNHYLGCSNNNNVNVNVNVNNNRGVWVSFENPEEGFPFYLGLLVPNAPRFRSVRPTALLTGPGLPVLTDEERNKIPTEIQNDPVWNNGQPDMRGILVESPADQSTCDHVGTTMTGYSSVQDGRCSYMESNGQSFAWPVLDVEDMVLPVQGGRYHLVVWVQDHTTAKLTFALGSWIEDFLTPFEPNEPSCTLRLQDFHERYNRQAAAAAAANTPLVECDHAVVESSPEIPIDAIVEAAEICVKGVVCTLDEDNNCVTAGIPYQTPSMVCGGRTCPAATALWQEVNMRMMMDMMDLQYTGNPDIDFVRGMIPHHEAAVEMCRILIEDLTCTEVSDSIDTLDGLVHFCNHVELEQELEVGGMRRWLAEKELDEKAPCPVMAMAAARQENHDDESSMMESCGDTSAQSSAALIHVNHQMHSGMAIDVSCEHSIDFVRGMIPHHEGAVGMCNVLLQSTTDSYLMELCQNITYTQYGEIAWMHEWMGQRGYDVLSPCEECAVTGDSMDHGTSHSGMMGMDEMHSNMSAGEDSENGTATMIMDETMMSDFNETDDLLSTEGEQEQSPQNGTLGMPPSMPSMTTPCEDLLSTSTFCHLIGQDAYCRCSDVVGELGECGSTVFLPGIGGMDVSKQCARTCRQCPTRMPLFHYLCDDDHTMHSGDDDHDHGMMMNDDMDDTTSSTRDSSSSRLGFRVMISVVFGAILFTCC